jgi:hypothetical protein
MENKESIGLPACEVVYPLLLSIYGEPKRGKTYFVANLPNVVIIDFPPAKFGYRTLTIDPIALKRTVGEGFRSLFTLERQEDNSFRAVPKISGFDFQNQYHFVKSWEDFQMAVEEARLYKDTLPEGSGNVWVVIDDTHRWRAMEVMRWKEDKKLNPKGNEWPAQNDFGVITQAMNAEITELQQDFNVCLVHRLTTDFKTGEPKAQFYPPGVEYVSDLVMKIDIMRPKDGKPKQVVTIDYNGHVFECDPSYNDCKEIEDPTPEDVLITAQIPKELW